MQRFIVEIIDHQGRRQWVFLNGRDTTDIRKQVEESGKGFTVNEALYDTDPKVQDLLTMHEGPTGFTIQTFDKVSRIPEAGQRKDEEDLVKWTPPPIGDDEKAFGPSNPSIESLADDTREFRFSQFLRGLQDRGVGTSGIAGRARLNQFAPTQARFLAEQALNKIPGITDPYPLTFAQFTQQNPLAGRAANVQAGNLFQRALGAGAGIDPGGAGFEGFSPLQQQLLNPQTASEAQRLGDLALGSARGRLGASSEFLPDSNELFARFGAQAGTDALSFGDFLNKKIFGQQRIG